MCSVATTEVRPFWGRVFAYAGSTAVITAVMLVSVIYGGMHAVGYQVTLRQLGWPPAWSELRAVRADLFIEQARANYLKGNVRDAINSLSVAYELNPHHFQVGILLAQFYQSGNPSESDALYRNLMVEHPDRRKETARAWFQSLLMRGRMPDIAELAWRQLVLDPEQASVWIHALLFSTRHTPDIPLLVKASTSEAVPAPAREVIRLGLQVRQAPAADKVRLLVETPSVSGFPYDRVFRLEELIRLGRSNEALTMLASARSELAGRDVARLLLAIYATGGAKDRLRQEFGVLLAPSRRVSAAEVTLLAVHLVNYPDRDLLRMVSQTLGRLPAEPAEARVEAAIAVFCAAGVQKDSAEMGEVLRLLSESFGISPVGLRKLQLFFDGKGAVTHIETLLPSINSLSLELNYALLDRYTGKVEDPSQSDRWIEALSR